MIRCQAASVRYGSFTALDSLTLKLSADVQGAPKNRLPQLLRDTVRDRGLTAFLTSHILTIVERLAPHFVEEKLEWLGSASS